MTKSTQFKIMLDRKHFKKTRDAGRVAQRAVSPLLSTPTIFKTKKIFSITGDSDSKEYIFFHHTSDKKSKTHQIITIQKFFKKQKRPIQKFKQGDFKCSKQQPIS